MYLFFCEDDSAEELVLQPFQGDGEVNNGGTSTDFGGVRRVGQLAGDIQPKIAHHVHLFVSHFHLQTECHRYIFMNSWEVNYCILTAQ